MPVETPDAPVALPAPALCCGQRVWLDGYPPVRATLLCEHSRHEGVWLVDLPGGEPVYLPAAVFLLTRPEGC